MKKITSIVLTALLATTVAFGMSGGADAWGGHGGYGQNGHHRGEQYRHGDRCFGDNLSLSASQKLEIKKLDDKWFSENEKDLREVAWQLRDYRYDISAGRDISPERTKELKEKMVALEVKRMERRQAQYKLLTADQVKLADQIHQDCERGRGFHHRWDGKEKRGSYCQEPELNQKMYSILEKNRKALWDMRDEMHKAITSGASETDLVKLAEKRVDLRLEMNSQMGQIRCDMRNSSSPMGGMGRHFRGNNCNF